MKVRTIVISAAAAAVVIAGALLVFMSVAEKRERIRTVENLVEEGFQALRSDPDEAARLARTARDYDEGNMGVLILLGRANFEKKRYSEALKVFNEAMNRLEDFDLLPELSYHAGLSYLHVYNETGIEGDWREAFKFLSEAAALGAHRHDANFALGWLFLKEDFFDREKFLLYWERAFRIEREMNGYPGSGEDGACPHCRKEFQGYGEDETVKKLLERYSQS